MSRKLGTVLVPFVLALLVAAALPVAAGEDGGAADPAGVTADEKANTVKLVVKVLFKKENGKRKPLRNAEVFAFVDGVLYYACTNKKGRAVFKNLPAGGTVHALATGPALSDAGCKNRKFKNPSTKKLMYSVYYDNHHGVRVFDSFDLPADGKKVVKFKPRDAKKRKKICAGLKVTIVGTWGDDNISGTPDPDVINALGGDDVVEALCGEDVVCAGAGDDEVYGDNDNDWIFGERGDDYLEGNAGDDAIDGGPGTDECFAEAEVRCE